MSSISKLKATLARREASVVAAKQALDAAIKECKHENCTVVTHRKYVSGYSNNGYAYEFSKVCNDCKKVVATTTKYQASPIWD